MTKTNATLSRDVPYRERIAQLIDGFPLPIDRNALVEGRVPTSATSDFLTNKEQGDWAERLAVKAINDAGMDLVAVPYGRSDSISAGDPGFAAFYRAYQEELNSIGKKPDILLFRKCDAPADKSELCRPDVVSRAVAALEVRSSSFISRKYKAFMESRVADAERRCVELRDAILQEPYGGLLKAKSPAVYSMLRQAVDESFRELDFRRSAWSSSEDLRTLSRLLKELKDNIAKLHNRDHLSITPKLEDLALVGRWISNFNVQHFYLQVFFDCAYMVSFERILSLCCDSQKEGRDFTIESSDVKNQGKTTVKVNIDVGEPVIGRIDMPLHHSEMKELDRGRLLFYVKFDGGTGYLDVASFRKAVGA